MVLVDESDRVSEIRDEVAAVLEAVDVPGSIRAVVLAVSERGGKRGWWLLLRVPGPRLGDVTAALESDGVLHGVGFTFWPR